MKKAKDLPGLLDEIDVKLQEMNQKLDHLIRRLRQCNSNHVHNNHFLD